MGEGDFCPNAGEMPVKLYKVSCGCAIFMKYGGFGEIFF